MAFIDSPNCNANTLCFSSSPSSHDYASILNNRTSSKEHSEEEPLSSLGTPALKGESIDLATKTQSLSIYEPKILGKLLVT